MLLIFLVYHMYTLQALKKETRKEILNLSERVDNLQTELNFQKKGKKDYRQKTLPSLKREEQEFLERYKEEVLKELDTSIADIVPGKPIMGGNWLLVNATFLTPDIILVHYEDGHIPGQMIVRTTKTEKGYSWELLANEFIE